MSKQEFVESLSNNFLKKLKAQAYNLVYEYEKRKVDQTDDPSQTVTVNPDTVRAIFRSMLDELYNQNLEQK